MKLHFGLEFEFFVTKGGGAEFVPALLATKNLDGNAAIGELRTGVHDSMESAVFELLKLIHNEKKALKSSGHEMHAVPAIKLSKQAVIQMRAELRKYGAEKIPDEEIKSIYGKSTGNILPPNVLKASLQLNMSMNVPFSVLHYDKVEVGDQFRYDKRVETQMQSVPFDYVEIIRALDHRFAKYIKGAGRTPGVYSIKDGKLGRRVEYRSLPNVFDGVIQFDKLDEGQVSYQEDLEDLIYVMEQFR